MKSLDRKKTRKEQQPPAGEAAKTEQVSPYRRKLLLGAASATALGLGVPALLVPRRIDEKDVLLKKDESIPYTEEQMLSFFEARMRPVLEGKLLKRDPSIPEINARYSTLISIINNNKKHTAPLQMHYYLKYAKQSRKVIAAFDVVEGQPLISIITPAFMDIYKALKTDKVQDIDAILSNLLIIATMHEFDHLALGHKSTPDQSREEILQREVESWAETCENTIRFFVEKGLPISKSENDTYEAWIRSGRSVMSREWNDFIKRKYADANWHPTITQDRK